MEPFQPARQSVTSSSFAWNDGLVAVEDSIDVDNKDHL